MLESKYYKNAFLAMPTPCLLFSPNPPYLTIEAANAAYLQATGSQESDLVGKGAFVAFPNSPKLSSAPTIADFLASIDQVIATAKPHVMATLNYDIPIRGTQDFETKYWKIENIPLLDDTGSIVKILHAVTDVTQETLSKQLQQKFEAQSQYIQNGLENTKKELNKIMDSSLDVICSIDKEGNFIKLNAATKKFWGLAPEELVGKAFIDFVHPEDRTKTNDAAVKIMAGAEMTNFENRHLRKDGTLIPIAWSARWDKKEEVMYCIARDATEKLKNELALIESESRYKHLFENNPMPLAIWDLETLKIIDCNDEALIKYGYSRNEFLQLTIKDIRPAEDTTIIETAVKNLDLNINIDKLVLRHKKKNGELMSMEVSGHLINYKGKKASLVMLNDVTEKLKSDKIIIEANKRYQYVTKATFDAIWDWDLVTNKIYWGEGFASIFGYNLKEIKTDISSWTDHIHPQDVERVTTHVNHTINGTGINWEDEYKYQKSDNTYAYVADRGFVIRDIKGKAIRMVGAIHDITKRKNDEFALQQSEARHRGIIASQTNYVIRTDLGGNYTYCNQKFIDDFGWVCEPINLIGINGMTSIMDYHHERVAKAVEKCFANLNQVFKVEIDKPAQNGGILTTIWDFICLTDSLGRPMEIQCVGIDISEWKKAETAYINTLEDKNTILESIRDAFFAVDKNWIVTYWNKEAEIVLRKPKSEILGCGLWEVFSQSIGSYSYKMYHEALEKKLSVHFEDYYQHSENWYEISAYPSDNGLSVYLKDITDRKMSDIKLKKLNENSLIQAGKLTISNKELEKLSEEKNIAISQLTESKKSYSDLFHISPQPMWVYDEETLQFLNVNNAAIKNYGYSADEFLAMSIRDIRPKEDLPEFDEAIRIRLAKKSENIFTNTVFRHTKKNGEIINVEIQTNAFNFNNKKARLVLASDITERLLYIKAIEEQNIKLQEIAYAQSHIVRAPLARMMGILGIMKDLDVAPPEYMDWLAHLLTSGKELDNVIKDIVRKTERIGIAKIK